MSEQDHQGRNIYGNNASAEAIVLSIITNSLLLSEGLVLLLSEFVKLSLLATYKFDTTLTTSLPNPNNHIILIDGNCPDNMLIQCLQDCAKAFKSTPTVLIDLKNDKELIVACIEAGAKGYTIKGNSARDVARLLRRAQCGEVQCSPDVTAHIFDRLVYLSKKQYPSLPSLTPRQKEILEYVALGQSNKEIAQALFIEVRTVKHHVHNILHKLNVRHRWDAARLAKEQGWLEVS